MLDNGTKRRIDTARDILVGKVPDPKSQVEQITIALIYKFMDDMDAESEELGGSRKFFAGQFARYGWAKLMRSGLGGHETLNLYAEGITKIPENPGIPLLFRDIFKNAYLPYRDPETLRAFLKIIDEFEYDHSERLGDAFEYLLSVLGSQGDAGQFRTPRHIIDFMVKIVDPKKNETILDPACGTAGFLISSYKHILKANTDAKGNSTLTPDQRGRLAKNLKGYDISPDMVRLSLVNMYLHGFADPHIHEYDTLTSEEKWNEFADVILANPPFMSPKGGIRPHKRFSVQSKRSEVLFVDYMAEHLTPSGRAGIIVPEGIIFQSQAAYKQLRKILVEDYLVAVVSLPAGIFNPYAGVKTSILILDKSLARKANTIGFFKVENDGFGLGAQRRPIDKNDLPQVQADIGEYLKLLRTGESLAGFKPSFGLIVKKDKVTANGEYNLSGERYRVTGVRTSTYPNVSIGELCKPEYGFTARAAEKGDARFIRITDIAEDGTLRKEDPKFIMLTNEARTSILASGDILVARTGATYGKTMLFNEDYPAVFASFLIRLRFPEHLVHPRYYWSFAQSNLYWNQARNLMTGGGQPQFNGNALKQVKIPLPPLEVQKAIVAEIEGYQKVIDGARAVIDNYRPHIPIDPQWPMVELGEMCEIIMGQSPPGETYNKDGHGVPLINGPVEFGPEPFSKTIVNQYTTAPTKMCERGDLILCVRGSTTGRMNIAGYSGCIGRGVAAIRTAKSQNWVNYVINSLRDRIYHLGSGSTFPNITLKDLAALQIPLPPLATQQAIVAEIEAEQALVNANRELIVRFEKKIQDTLARVWGKDEPIPA